MGSRFVDSEAAMWLDSFGRALVERFGLLNVWALALLVGAALLDRALARRARASLRIALYAPIALRIVLPLDWNIGLVGGAQAAALVAPILQVGARANSDPASISRFSWYALGAVLYVVIATLIAVRAITARVRLGRVVAEAHRIAAPLSGVRYRLVEHDELGPMVVGLLSPRIVLPRHLLAAGEERALACVLRHEVAHLERRDPWLSLAMQVLAVAAWPVAALWIAMARVRHLIELACDEAALAGADAIERRQYGHTLLDMAEWRSLAVATMSAGELHFGSTLRARIEAIVSQRHWPLAVQALALSFASIALFIVCGGSAAHAASNTTDADGYGYEFAPATKPNLAEGAPLFDGHPTNQDGRMAPERIEAAVLGSFDAFSTCYEAGRKRAPELSGVVVAKYVINETGRTQDVTDDGSTLPDQAVIRCVLDVFRTLRFDESHRGNVTVVYPIQFAP